MDLANSLGTALEGIDADIVTIEEVLVHYSRGLEKTDEWIRRLNTCNE